MAITVRNDPSAFNVGGLAYQGGLGEYNQRQRDRNDEFAFRAQQQMFAAEQQAQARAEQIAAQQQAMMYQQAAGERDMALRNAYGQQNAWMQFGMQGAQDERNFVQAKEQDEWRAAMEDKQMEARFNAEGKQRMAELQKNRAAFERHKPHMTKEQIDYTESDLRNRELGIKGNPRNMLPDPPTGDELWEKAPKKVLEDGRIVTFDPETGKVDKIHEKLPTLKEANESRERMLREEMESRERIAGINARKARIDAREKQYDKDDIRRDAREDRLAKMYEDEVGSDGLTPKYTPDQAREKARREAEKLVPDRRSQRAQLEADYDEYREWLGGDAANEMGNGLPPDLDEIDNRAEYSRVLAEIQAWKKERDAARGVPAPTPPAPPQQQPVEQPLEGYEDAVDVPGTGVAPQGGYSLNPFASRLPRDTSGGKPYVPGQPATQAAPQGQGAGAPTQPKVQTLAPADIDPKKPGTPGSSQFMPVIVETPAQAKLLPKGTWIRKPDGSIVKVK